MRIKLFLILVTVSVFQAQARAIASESNCKQSKSRLLANRAEPNGVLSLGDVLALVLVRNPELSAFSYEVRAQEAQVLQNSLLPNPELGVEVEEFGGTGATRGFDGAETTLAVSQLIETANKRTKRTNVARLDKELADWDYKAKRLDIFTEAAKAYAEVLTAQERVGLAEELNKLASEVKYAVGHRVGAGKESPLEETKADVSLAASQIELNNFRRSLEIAKTKLSSYWGSTKPAFAGLTGSIYETKPHSTFDEFAAQIANNPDLARWKAEINQKKAVVALEKSRSAPDVTVSAGTKYLAEPGDTAFVVGLSIPLPIFDRNQGNISSARARVNKTRELARQANVSIGTQLVDVYQSMISAYQQTLNLKDKIIPASEKAFDAARQGYDQGKFGYLDLLDAQRTLFQAKQQYLDLLLIYHQTHANLERLVGGK